VLEEWGKSWRQLQRQGGENAHSFAGSTLFRGNTLFLDQIAAKEAARMTISQAGRHANR